MLLIIFDAINYQLLVKLTIDAGFLIFYFSNMNDLFIGIVEKSINLVL